MAQHTVQGGRNVSRTMLASASAALCGIALGSHPAAAQPVAGGAPSLSQVGPAPVAVQPPNAATNPFTGLNSRIAVNDSITTIEQQTLQQAMQGVSDPTTANQLLGKLVLYDRNLSPNRQQACETCHTKQAGFTGGVSSINASIVAYSGALFYRWGNASRRPTCMPPSRRCCTTMPAPVSSWAAISGTTAPPARSRAIPRETRPCTPPWIRSKWRCPTLLASFTGSQPARTARSSSGCGARSRSP